MQVASVFEVIGDVLHRFDFKLSSIAQPGGLFTDFLERGQDRFGLRQEVMWVRVEAKDALRLRGSTQTFDGLRHQSLWRQEARQPRMPREEHAVGQLPHSGHASSTTDIRREPTSFIHKPHRAHSLSNQLTRQVLAQRDRATLIPLGVRTSKAAMAGCSQQI